jgi:hypothetical protein
MEIDCTDFLGGGRGYGDGGGLPLFQTRGGGDWKVKKKKKRRDVSNLRGRGDAGIYAKPASRNATVATNRPAVLSLLSGDLRNVDGWEGRCGSGQGLCDWPEAGLGGAQKG